MVDPERADIVWRKSSLSGGGECVEVAFIAEQVALRQSHDPAGPILTFTQGEWAAFVGGVHLGEFDSAVGPSASA